MRTRPIICLLLVFAAHHIAATQNVHFLPFASEGNAIELAVANRSTIEATDITVSVQNAPVWLLFAKKEQSINSVAGGEEGLAMFSFSVDKSAPIGTEQTISFVITTSSGQFWIKDIRIAVAAPETFELFQNFPNPFNPSTVISYQLPVDTRVNLKLYNMLGQEVATLVNEERKAGFHQEEFDARHLASGIYIYRLTSDRYSAVRRLVLLK